MKLHPQQAPLYGQCVLTVQLCSEELVDDGQEVEYFLFFCGSTQRHVTSTLRSDHDTLRALCPAHDCCESVRVVLCSVRPCGVSLSREQVPGVHGSSSLVAPLAEHRFSFVQDLAFDMAQFLVSTAGRSDALEGALLLDECQIPLQECERLDESLSLALKHLALPPGWSLLGSTLKNSTDPVPQETLLHFAARRGLRRVADFLLCQPGAGQALRLANRQGHTPFDIAGFRGHEQLQQLLSQAEQEGETERDCGTETTNQSAHSDVRVVCHLPKLNTYTLTVGPCQGLEPPTLQRCVEHLRHLICHLQAKGVQSLELQSESLHTAAECSDGLETQPACLGRLQQQQLWSLDKLALGKQADTEDVGNSNISGGGRGGNGGNAERDEESPLGPPTQECSPDNGLQSSEDGVCLRANTERDYHQTEEEQRRGEREEQERDPAASVVDDQSLCSDERVHRQPERENPALGALSSHTSSCGKQTGLTDREEGDSGEGEEAAHREGQRGASEGREGAKQDGEEESTAGRREEESRNRGELTTLDSSRTLSDTMGITPSVEFSDLSDSSDSDTKENTEENLGNEEEEETEEECNQKSLSDLSDDGLSLDEETPGSKGLRGPISSSPASSSTPSNGSDVKREVTSESPVMEGLHKGEPPPSLPADTNTSLEQTQETAGGDYSTEEQQQTHCTAADGSSSSALETAHHSGDHTGSEEDTGRADGDTAVVCLQDRQIAVSGVCTESGWPLNEASIEDTRDFETVFDSVDYSETEDLTHCEASSETMPSSGAAHTDTDPGTNPGLSSDEEGSFRSALSSTTELFLPAQEASGPDTNEQESSCRTQPKLENPVPVQKKVVEQTDKELNVCGECCSQSKEMGLHLEQKRDALPEQEDSSRDMSSRDMNCEDAVPISPGSVPNSQLPTGMETVGQCDTVPNELDENSRPSDSWCPLDHSASKLMVIDSGQTFMNSAGSAPVSQASLGQETKGPLIPEVAGEQLISECFIGEPSVEPTLPENKDIQTIPESRYVTEEHNNTDMNVTQEGNRTDMNVENKQGPLGSKVTDGAIVKPDLSLLAEGREEGDISLVEVDPHHTEKSVSSQLASGEESIETNLRSIIQNVREDNSDSTTNERSSALDTDGDMGRSDAVNEVSPQVQISYAEYVPSQDDRSAPTAAMNRASWESPALENAMGLFPDKLNSAGGDSGCQTRPLEDMDALESGDTPDGRVAEDNVTTIHRDKDTSYPLSLSACPQPHTSQRTGSSGSSVFPSLSLSSSVGSSAHRDSGSDSESLLSAEPGDDNVFRKCDDVVTCVDSTSEVSVSCSSTDDTASVGPPCSSPDSCLEGQTQALGTWTPEESTPTGVNAVSGHGIGGEAGGAGETEEEAKDRVTEVVPTRRSALLLRSSLRSLSPLRRHSWGPGKNATGGGRGADTDMNQRSTLRSPGEGKPTFHRRSYSLEGLSGEQDAVKGPCSRGSQRGSMLNNEEERGGGSLVSLTEEQEDAGEHGNMEEQRSRRYRPLRHSCPPLSLPLTKSVSMLTISQKDIEASGQQHRKRRISFSFNLSPILLTKAKSHFHVDSPSSDDEDSLSMRSLSSTTGSLDYSISEEEPGPLRTDFEGKSSTKVGRTFSYLKSKMYKKTKEKDREKKAEKDKDTKDKKMVNGHLFTAVSSGQAAHCTHCNKAFNNKDAFHCTHCHSYVHKSCRESLPGCAKVKMKFTKHQLAVPDSSSIAATVTMRNKSSGMRERPWSAILLPDDHSSLAVASSRRHASMMAFHSSNLSKSISISNIAGPVLDEMPIKGLRYLSQSTDSLNRNSHVTESTESLTDEGTEMMDGQLMGEFEAEVKDLESDSWSLTVEQDLLKQLNTELIKRQDVIYELMQTEMHHVRTLRIMSEVYSKGLQKEVGLEPQTLDRLFPALDELLDLHSQHLHRLLERRRDNQEREDTPGGGFIVNRIGDVLLHQFSGSSAECMKRVYGKFCSRHNEAVNLYKELLTKDKRFQAFIKRKMSSSVVRRLGIPECILLVTQRITKYPGLILRMLQHTKESEDDYEDLNEAVRLVKEVITAVDDKVNEHEKRQRLKDIHARTDSKSIMRMRSGQMFAREDLLRGRRHIHDGPLQLKNTQGRLKDVHALLLSDVFVFLQEKDQKYVFASLDHRSTVLSLQKLIVREVANEERGLFLITVGSDRPEMVEVLASSRDERNTWIQLIQDAMHCIEKDDDEGIPSETEEDKRLLETKAKEMRDLLRQKDEQIVTLLEEKARVFREMCECGGDAAAAGGGVGGGAATSRGEGAEQRDGCCPAEPSLFRAVSGSQEALPRGEPIMKHALLEVETLQTLVNGSLGGAMAVGGQQDGGGGGVGPVCLPRRAETFGGFDSHQMNSKSGDRDESGDTAADLRRTESDSVLKKGGNANLLLLLKRNSEQVLHSVSHLHDLLSALQAVVVQQDSVIEDQRQVLVLSNSSTSNNSSSSSTAPSSRHSSRPNSLIEQEKQRSLEKHRQELASLQRQQSAHAEERRRREKEWEKRESELMDREVLLHVQEEDTGRRRVELEREREELHNKKEEYQRDLERLRDAQRKLERDRDTLQRERERVEQIRLSEGRTNETTPSSESEDSLHHHHHHPADRDLPELLLLGSSSPPRLQPTVPPRKSQSLPRGKSLNPFTSSNSSSSHQMPGRLLQLASKNKDKDKDKKEKKKKKKKEGKEGTTDTLHLEGATLDGEIFFC